MREGLGLVAYALGKYDEAVRELRTHRRLSGSNHNLALLADSERGRGRPAKAIEMLGYPELSDLDEADRIELVLVAAGAHSDLGQLDEAQRLLEAENLLARPSGHLVRLQSAYSDLLRLRGDAVEADKWEKLARRTAASAGALFGDEEPDPNEEIEIFELAEETDVDVSGESDAQLATSADGESGDQEIVEEFGHEDDFVVGTESADAETEALIAGEFAAEDVAAEIGSTKSTDDESGDDDTPADDEPIDEDSDDDELDDDEPIDEDSEDGELDGQPATAEVTGDAPAEERDERNSDDSVPAQETDTSVDQVSLAEDDAAVEEQLMAEAAEDDEAVSPLDSESTEADSESTEADGGSTEAPDGEPLPTLFDDLGGADSTDGDSRK
ncbi:hypothetical protein LWF01_05245 [Saxibacter everestensis]|uniref:Tetratricopeptide repeat protein n=1 Tax=Saxibacter everestensis TaxID=2909229 RepID=A0ABY8QWI2_9MICO|nr:hypothetical protein LWF01_05245 [Brevibacteriaceae bacterium ZFBP1038]